MSFLEYTRRQQRPQARRALGLFALVWINFALQPCAMAMNGDHEPDCSPCPVSQSQDHAISGQIADPMPCATASADCEPLDELIPQPNVKDMPGDMPADFGPVIGEAFSYKTNHYLPALYTPDKQGASPPLNVLYCVYLK